MSCVLKKSCQEMTWYNSENKKNKKDLIKKKKKKIHIGSSYKNHSRKFFKLKASDH